MNSTTLKAMSKVELEKYLKFNGIKAKTNSASAMREAVLEARERIAHIEVLGVSVDIPIKHFRSKGIQEMWSKCEKDEDFDAFVQAVLNDDDKYAELLDACRDDDGELDVDAYSFAIASIFTSDELKN